MRYADDVDQFLAEDGKPDHDAMSRAADALLEARSYLAATKAGDGRARGSFDGGARGTNTDRVTLTRDEVARMTPEQVAAAIGRGQVSGAVGGWR
ncbi:MAG: hypothetical protein ACXVJ7_05745 [Acidimicrobiia bacterium]